ncbi:MAG: hypothetical protein MUO58_00035 [Anaerolineales bacterium]|nr:hypothetical protein [Anaerolineales bacterium]
MTLKFVMEHQPLSRRQHYYNPNRWLDVPYRLIIKAITVISISLLIASCTRTTVPLLPINAAVTEIPQEDPSPLIFATFEPSGMYAVVGIPAGEILFLRNPAGIAGNIVDELAYDARGIAATGDATNLGSSIWMEIQSPGGSRGWVKSLNMTEDISQEQFCQDARAVMVLDQSLQSIQEHDGDLLLQVVNPRRGLIIRHDWWNPEVIVPVESISGIFDNPREIEWGLLSGGKFKIQGSFKDIILPLLEDSVLNSSVPVCAELPSGKTSRPALWPTEYTSLNYFAIHRPAPEGGNSFNWRTWVFVIEYIDGQPFLTSIIHFHGDV